MQNHSLNILMLSGVFTFVIVPVDLMQEGNTIVVTNAKVDMFKGSMRLAVDRFGRVEITEAASFSVPEDINMSLIEFERIDVVV